MTTVLTSISNFIQAQSHRHNAPELLARWSVDMETQVNVSAGDGERVDGRGHTFEDANGERWWNIRCPRNANSDPHFEDYELTWPLDDHVSAIGMTGWNWRERCSKFVGFDFDAITGHAAGVGVSQDDLTKVQQAASALGYVETRLSTSGTGLHLYVHVEDIPTATHTEHAALARSILGVMSTEAGFDFTRSVDACGMILWCWHDKNKDTDGFTLVKEAQRKFNSDDLPFNWLDHADVTTRKRPKMKVAGLDDKDSDDFDKLCSGAAAVPLDEAHKRVIAELSKTDYSTVWNPDFNCVHTHTAGLAKLHAAGKTRGVFQTNSPGHDAATPNCFMFPTADGAWQVFRFSPGVTEAPTWTTDGWTGCQFNADPDLPTASRANGGAEKSGDGGGFVFGTGLDAMNALEAIGKRVAIPKSIDKRETHVTRTKDGRLTVWVKKESKDTAPGLPWVSKRGGWWEHILQGKAPKVEAAVTDKQHDTMLRVTVTPQGEAAGMYVKSDHGTWDNHQLSLVRAYLASRDIQKTEVDALVGRATADRWMMVNVPFQDEFPGGRSWNKDAAQFRVTPSDRSEELKHPHWDSLFNHLGQTLTEPLSKLDWAKRANIKTGGDYLRAWLACCLRHPFEPLPFLFLWSHKHEQGVCGKSLLWESIHVCLIDNAVVKGSDAISSKSGFNGELEHAVIVALDDFDASAPKMYDKLKDLITSALIYIRKMRTNGFSIPNKLKWIQTANGLEHMAKVNFGDNRFTGAYVPPVAKAKLIPKAVMLEHLSDEAGAFLRTLLDLELPPRMERLRIPAIDTDSKRHVAAMNQTAVESFLDGVFHVPGARVAFSDLWSLFVAGLDDDHIERAKWNKQRFSRALPHHFPTGRAAANKMYVGNLSLTDDVEPSTPWVTVGKKLNRKGE